MTALVENFRIDKNVAFNILEFNKYEDKQTQIIIQSLVVYFSYAFQKDLFGYGLLDPYDFAKKMKIDKDTLFKKHPKPKQAEISFKSTKELYADEEKNGKFSQSRVWDSYLENALFILSSTPLFNSYKGSTDESNFVTLNNYILIKEVSIHLEKRNNNRNTKFYYRYKLDDHYERNLRKFFHKTNLSNYIIAKKRNVEDFYLHMSNIYHSYKMNGINLFRWKLETILEYFEISRNLEIKYQKRNLNKAFRKVEEIMKEEIPGIKFDWMKGENQKYKYVPFVVWDKVSVEVYKNDNYNELDDVFYSHLKRNLYDIFLTQQEDDFYLWIKNNDYKDIKISTYISTYSLYRKVTKTPGVDTYAISFFRKVSEAKSNTEIEQCFTSYQIT